MVISCGQQFSYRVDGDIFLGGLTSQLMGGMTTDLPMGE